MMVPTIPISDALSLPAIGVGCMRLKTLSAREAEYFLGTALDLGLCFFDHADIYGEGLCETMFSEALSLHADARERVFLQSKCGIRRGFYDFSAAHIRSSVEGSLKRLKTDYLDILLLHRPDVLCDPEEVAQALSRLKEEGKVRYFGVSNHSARAIELLQSAVQDKLLINQLQFGPAHAYLVESSLNLNRHTDSALFHDDGVWDYCRLKHITVQAWSPFQYAPEHRPFALCEACAPLNETIARIAEELRSTPGAVSIAWVLRSGARIQPIVGTMNVERLREYAAGMTLSLSREQWYEIYRAGGHLLP